VRVPTPEPESPPPSIYSRNATSRINGNEWSSPAFIKRARTSYGSLFDDGYDPFEEADGAIPGKGRKRTRLSSTWRFTSRSPPPEIESIEQDSVQTSPEPALNSAPKMVDEGNQTIGYEATEGNGDEEELDAAVTLAHFSQEATDVENVSIPIGQLRNIVATDENPRKSNLFVSNNSAMAPPTIATPLAHVTAESDFGLHPPSSPRLQPLSSDNLPLVSPLVPPKLRDFTSPLYELNGQFSESQPTAPDLALSIAQDDIYDASPTCHSGEQDTSALNNFPEAVSGFVQSTDVEEPLHPEPFHTEHQYGLWQSVNTQSSNSDSLIPAAQAGGEELHEILYHEKSNQDKALGQEDSFSTPHGGVTNSQYPQLGEEMHELPISTWGQDSRGAAWLDLPVLDVENRLSTQHDSYSRDTAASPSNSIHSAVIDLTESDDEREDGKLGEEQDQESDLEMVDDQEIDVESNGEYYRVSAENEVDEPMHYRERSTVRGPFPYEDDEGSGEEQSQTSQDDELEGDFSDEDGYPDNVLAPQEEYYSDVEDPEGYSVMDEEQEDFTDDEISGDDGAGPAEQSAPVFIDLLSSDDETPVAAACAQALADDEAAHFDTNHRISYEGTGSQSVEEDGIETDEGMYPSHKIIQERSC
jgi:hypothetical protein